MAGAIRKVGMLERLGYRPGSRRVEPTKTPEQIEADRVRHDNWVSRCLADMEAKQAQRGLIKIIDHHARVAVEGNTDANHDNVEAAE